MAKAEITKSDVVVTLTLNEREAKLIANLVYLVESKDRPTQGMLDAISDALNDCDIFGSVLPEYDGLVVDTTAPATHDVALVKPAVA